MKIILKWLCRAGVHIAKGFRAANGRAFVGNCMTCGEKIRRDWTDGASAHVRPVWLVYLKITYRGAPLCAGFGVPRRRHDT